MKTVIMQHSFIYFEPAGYYDEPITHVEYMQKESHFSINASYVLTISVKSNIAALNYTTGFYRLIMLRIVHKHKVI